MNLHKVNGVIIAIATKQYYLMRTNEQEALSMALTLADYLRDHPVEFDDKSLVFSQTTAGFTTCYEKVCSSYI